MYNLGVKHIKIPPDSHVRGLSRPYVGVIRPIELFKNIYLFWRRREIHTPAETPTGRRALGKH